MAGMQVHFPHLYPEVNDQIMALTPPNIPSRSHMVSRSEETIDTLFQEISAPSQTLATKQSDQLPRSNVVMEAFCSVKHSLTTAITSTEGLSALLAKEVIAPNQKT
jgi:hypothetical protein